MDFTLDPAIDDVRRRVRRFVDDRLIPLEADRANYDEHENVREDVLSAMRSQARAEGLWALQMPKARGGGGLSFVGMAACYEEMNRSIFGPATFNSAAPDDGTMMVLERVGTDAQKARWLQPIVDGKVRSSFVMTEPHPGGGSDPAMIRTTAERRGDKWVVHGHKWFITGAAAASHFLLIARTSDDARKGHTAFMYHRDQPGSRLLRRIPIMGPEEHGGHGELVFEGLEIPDGDRLLGVGDGLKVAQIRLGPARLTHCMRWLGLARRSLEIANAYIDVRMSGGRRLADDFAATASGAVSRKLRATFPARYSVGERGVPPGPSRARARRRPSSGCPRRPWRPAHARACPSLRGRRGRGRAGAARTPPGARRPRSRRRAGRPIRSGAAVARRQRLS